MLLSRFGATGNEPTMVSSRRGCGLDVLLYADKLLQVDKTF